jgi:hypothetical protein
MLVQGYCFQAFSARLWAKVSTVMYPAPAQHFRHMTYSIVSLAFKTAQWCALVRHHVIPHDDFSLLYTSR